MTLFRANPWAKSDSTIYVVFRLIFRANLTNQLLLGSPKFHRLAVQRFHIIVPSAVAGTKSVVGFDKRS